MESSRESAEAAAAAWIAKRERDDWTRADQAELDAWLAAQTDHRVAWLRLDAAWREIQRLKTLGTEALPGAVPKADQIYAPFFGQAIPAARGENFGSENGERRRGKTRRLRVGALAATLLIGAIALLQVWVWISHSPAYQTAVGSVEAVPLADGSQVTLNTNTRIRVDLTPTERRVDLAQGEAYFEVAKDPARPFIVDAGGTRVIAVGTRFSVRRDGDELQVVVTEGKVRVEQAAAVATRTPLQLAAGGIAHAVADSVIVQDKAIEDLEQRLSWRRGYLVFDDVPLAEAVAEFNRYNQRPIVIDDPSVAAIRIGGNFRATNVEAFLRLIKSDLPVVFTEESDRIVLTAAQTAATDRHSAELAKSAGQQAEDHEAQD